MEKQEKNVTNIEVKVIIVNSKLLLVFLEQLCDTSGQEMYPVSE
jgi:hypothetical protein